MVMMDRVIGGSGCSFSALIALKLFANGKRSSLKQDMDFEEALDEILENEVEDEELEKPFKWYSSSNAFPPNIPHIWLLPQPNFSPLPCPCFLPPDCPLLLLFLLCSPLFL